MVEEIPVEDIIYSYLSIEETYIQPHNMKTLEYPFEITSDDYLNFSRNDLISGDITEL
ncbi:hypothetical protein [Paenibacillus sp. MMS18-CY102]|uniref:hypothetical protein n=1 Tax=Paenibacillus sp. MMS18-CY102 TaxID=2682849 RepID=UPI0013659BF9|nr:hypothetical protein [Paenibacillus sp. MMS18-CY102]MWC29495.1 hypothetical protein [Paenibacillus sp. MMS18-CY102]